MQNFYLSEGYVVPFEGEIRHCRRLYDDVIIFGRDGSIAGCRSDKSAVKNLKNFYDLTSDDDAALIESHCISFGHRWILIDTPIGCAAIFIGLFAACGILVGVIGHFPKDALRAHFERIDRPEFIASASFASLPRGELPGNLFALIDGNIKTADSALSHRLITAATYRAGASLGELLSERILDIAEFIGCVGHCKSELKLIPKLENFCSETFISISLCLLLFVRETSADRRFEFFIGEHKEHVAISFYTEVGDGFKLFDNHGTQNELIALCERIAATRDAFFYCSLEKGRLKGTFAPYSDPLTVRNIKQDFENLVNRFWNG